MGVSRCGSFSPSLTTRELVKKNGSPANFAKRGSFKVQYNGKLILENGVTEAQVNRLKLVKRKVYGRANFDLLRRRFEVLAMLADILLPDPNQLASGKITMEDQTLGLVVSAKSSTARCPSYGTLSSRVHSRYQRTLTENEIIH